MKKDLKTSGLFTVIAHLMPHQVPLLSGIKNGVRGKSMMALDKLT
jgi:hypothetical protein